jgi:hypothetical protein
MFQSLLLFFEHFKKGSLQPIDLIWFDLIWFENLRFDWLTEWLIHWLYNFVTVQSVFIVYLFMWLFEGYPFFYILIGILSHLVYYQLLRKFPHIELTSVLFIISCSKYLCIISQHLLWIFFLWTYCCFCYCTKSHVICITCGVVYTFYSILVPLRRNLFFLFGLCVARSIRIFYQPYFWWRHSTLRKHNFFEYLLVLLKHHYKKFHCC